MAQRPTFDINSISTADKLILGGAGAYFIWSLLPVWYHAGLNAWGGVTTVAAAMSVFAIAWTVLRILRFTANVNLNVKPGLIDLGLAGLGVLFTLLGLVVKRNGLFSFAWGLILGLLISLVWAYGAYMKYSEPADVMPPLPPGAPGPPGPAGPPGAPGGWQPPPAAPGPPTAPPTAPSGY